MQKAVPIWMYTALASMALIGTANPPQAQVVKPRDAAVTVPAAAGVASPDSVAPAIAFDGLAPLVMDRRDADGNPYATVILKNDGPKPQNADLSAMLIDGADNELSVVTDPAQKTVGPGPPHAMALKLKLKEGNGSATAAGRRWREKLPLRGYLILTTPGLAAAPVTRELRVTPAQPSHDADRLVLLSLLAALVAVGVGIWWASGKLSDRMGSPSWSDSWGSNTTLGASLLTVFVGLVVFPEQTRFLPKATYSVLSAVFPALVGLSPVIFGLIRTPVSPTGSKVEYQGYVWVFCVAAVFTLWGATGQLATLLYAIVELRATPAFPPQLSVLMFVIASALLAGVFLYGAVSVRQIIGAASAPVPARDPKPAQPDQGAAPATKAAPVDVKRNAQRGHASPRAVRDWPLL